MHTQNGTGWFELLSAIDKKSRETPVLKLILQHSISLSGVCVQQPLFNSQRGNVSFSGNFFHGSNPFRASTPEIFLSCNLSRGICSFSERNHGYYRFTCTWRERLVKLNREERLSNPSRHRGPPPRRPEFQQGQFSATYAISCAAKIPLGSFPPHPGNFRDRWEICFVWNSVNDCAGTLGTFVRLAFDRLSKRESQIC